MDVGLAQAVESADFRARSELSARLISTLSDIRHRDQLVPVIADFAATITRGLAEHLVERGWDKSLLTVAALFADGPLRDLNFIWRRWDDFVIDTWNYGLKHVGDCPFLLKNLHAVQMSQLTAAAFDQMDQQLEVIRSKQPVTSAAVSDNGIVNPLSPKRTKRQPHPNPESILTGKDRVTFQTASTLLGVTERRVRQLVDEGNLETVGKGHAKRITASSISRRLNARTNSEESGNARK
jgi:hypothetical protein